MTNPEPPKSTYCENGAKECENPRHDPRPKDNLRPCDICKRVFDANAARLAYNVDGKTPHYYCNDCMTHDEARAFFEQFMRREAGGENGEA